MAEEGGRVLIVDDDTAVCEVIGEFLKAEGYQPSSVGDGETALRRIAREPPDVVLLDIRLPGMDGMEVLRRMKKLDPDLAVVMISGATGVRNAVDAMRLGAEDYITKPCRQADVFRAVHRSTKERQMKRRLRHLSDRLLQANSLPELMGPSGEIAKLSEEVLRVGPSSLSVVVLGETGTGKELVARAIHQASAAREGQFVAVDCGAIPEPLFEAELFGHERGAFTGAERLRPGKFELARGGTLFLDEISNMPLSCQAKLLRALQEKCIYRVGGNEPIEIETRLLAASNKDLRIEATAGRFRLDLFYRLNEFSLTVPPLRERREDILYLAKRFIDLTSYELNKKLRGFTAQALELLMACPWHGNVRELRSVIRRGVLLADTLIDEHHLGHMEKELSVSVTGLPAGAGGDTCLPLREQVRQAAEAVERAAITRAMRDAEGNKAAAARQLKVDYKTLHTKLKRLGLAKSWMYAESETP